MESAEKSLFVEVLLPLHLPSSFTYRIPREYYDDISVGQRVAVQFGGKKIYSGIVSEVHSRIPQVQNVKYILAILDLEPIISEKTITFWRWIADYYCCYIGDVLVAALPSAFRLKSETKILINTSFEGDISSLSNNEQSIFALLTAEKSYSIAEIAQKTALEKNILPIIQNLIKKNIIITEEELNEKFKPKQETFIYLTEDYRNDKESDQKTSRLQDLFSQFEKNPKQKPQYLALLAYFSMREQGSWDVKKADLIAKNVSQNTINTLIRKGIMVCEKKNAIRFRQNATSIDVNNLTLTQEQQSVFDSIVRSPQNKVSLLFGVTSSGKTEVYIKLIRHTIAQNRQVLFLLPEIALTTQLILRLERYFGEKIGVYHSRFSSDERAEIFNKVKNPNKYQRYSVIIGSRSAVFLPFNDLGLIIIDEEHDISFKQSEQSPRYNAKDAAIWLAKEHSARVILGSATPSIESFYNCRQGKYNLFELKHRFLSIPLPQIIISDTKAAKTEGQMHSLFTKTLLDHIETALNHGEQVILFKNRRGYSPQVQCSVCGYVAKCPNCDVSLTLHKNLASLNCHYCDYNQPLIQTCPSCGSSFLKNIGFGTEKIEEELASFFPKARICRMDMDNTRQKNSYLKIITAFENRDIDILIGTQMVSKGLDFNNVSLVGVLDADSLLYFPDFRANERFFQLLTQVSGRSGRKKQGKVVIQTANPQKKAILDVQNNDYLSMYQEQIAERAIFHYPPFYHLVKITISHAEKPRLDAVTEDYFSQIRRIFSTERLFGPVEPQINRIRNRFLSQIWLKLEPNLSYSAAKTEILRLNEAFLADEKNKSVRIIVDIDPQ
ncbi:MAG: primosomal protein N' [Bacteroidales bacterium]|jgi:primosomal protein N' (replication factor Y)|nr:primosomal protein N' [Bacteroidales bacterium]